MLIIIIIVLVIIILYLIATKEPPKDEINKYIHPPINYDTYHKKIDYRELFKEELNNNDVKLPISIPKTAIVNELDETIFNDVDNIDFEENTFCVTGQSLTSTREEIEQYIESQGGIIRTQPSSKLNYLVICDEATTGYKFGGYGAKTDKALNLNKEGKANIIIIHEDDLY